MDVKQTDTGTQVLTRGQGSDCAQCESDADAGRSLTRDSATNATRITILLVFGLIVAAYVLLWSPFWYIGSDSGLYLSLARNMDEGRGYTYMGRPHRMVPPLTPLMLYEALQVTRSFGLINAIMIACMLGGFVFMYCTLRMWLDYRMALALTAASAFTYWQFRLGTIVGTDQPFFLLFWISLLCFARGYRSADRRTTWLAAGTALLLLGTGFRIASLLLLPMFAGAIWMEYQALIPSQWKRCLLICGMGAPFLLALAGYYVWGKQAVGHLAPRELLPMKAAAEAALAPNATPDDPDGSDALQEDSNGVFQTAGSHGRSVTRYCLVPRLALADVVKLPGLIGRWIADLLLVPSREVFTRLSQWSQAALGLTLSILAFLGLYRLVQARQWWIVMPILYMLIVAVMWGFRVIPRYLTPVLPMVLLWIAAGLGLAAGRIARGLGASDSCQKRMARQTAFVVPILVILANLPLLAVEIYVRHHGDFYTNTRQGAWAEVVDAAALIRRNLPATAVICTNDPLLRREIHLLTGRGVTAPSKPYKVMNPEDDEAIRKFFLITGAKYALIRYYDWNWPEWHLSLKGSTAGRSWWGYYVWDGQQDSPVRVTPPINRDWMRSLPDSAI